MLNQWFILPFNPEPWGVGAASVTRAGGKFRAFVAPDSQLVNYQNAVREHITQHYPERKVVDEPCSLRFYFWRRLDRYTTTSQRGHMRHVADATNMQKALEDALQGVVIENDRLVQRITSEIVRQDADTEPCIIACVSSIYRPSYGAEIPKEILDFAANMSDNLGVLDLKNVL